MTAVESSLDDLGPYAQQEPIAALSEFTQQVCNSYHESAGATVRKETQRRFFCSRMMYISEVMGRGVRINASWALTHAAMRRKPRLGGGEALAAQLVASAALQAVLMVLPSRLEVLSRISAFVDDTLNMTGPGKGDAHDELNTQMREVARFQTTQILQKIEHIA